MHSLKVLLSDKYIYLQFNILYTIIIIILQFRYYSREQTPCAKRNSILYRFNLFKKNQAREEQQLTFPEEDNTMYFSIIDNHKYWVVLSDGVVEKFIVELPTEILADEVAFQLQMAWNDGESWGENKMKKLIDPDGFQSDTKKAIIDSQNRNPEEQAQYNATMNAQLKEQEQNVRQQVLYLKK